MFRANQMIQPLCVRPRQAAVPRTAVNYVFDPEHQLPFQAHVRRTQVRSGPMAFGAPNWVGICGPGAVRAFAHALPAREASFRTGKF